MSRDRSTYSQSNLSALCNLFGQYSEEVQDAGVAMGIVCETRDNCREDILPSLHLNGQNRKADTQLNPDGLRTRCELFEKE